MKAQELRLGNYVNVTRTDQSPFRIDLIEHACEGHCKAGMNVHKYETPWGLIDGHPLTWELKDMSPIPLTEEWLLKFGFKEYDQFGWEHSLNVGAIKLYTRSSYGHIYMELEGIYLGDSIKYVHQLQNFYHGITGQELPYNNP
ncbi:hypothetical protein [Arcticibacter sp.]|uniref:hypothetical protein n=1 Tax=Arcticibacter sp. TaxID=1872630 RepID=UPI0038908FBE